MKYRLKSTEPTQASERSGDGGTRVLISSESVCIRCEDQVDVQYICECVLPESEARQDNKETIGEVNKEKLKRCGRGGPQDAPHSINRRNRNRIRRSLLRQMYWTRQQPGLSKEARDKKLAQLKHQLTMYPSSPRTTSRWTSHATPKPTKKGSVKSAEAKVCPAGGYNRSYFSRPNVYRPGGRSVKHFCNPVSRIRRELSHDKVCSRSRPSRRRYNVGTGRGQRRSRRSNGCRSKLWKMMKEFVRQRTSDETSLAADAPESEQECVEQDPAETPVTDGESVWKQMREDVLQRAQEDASRQAVREVDTGQGKGEEVLEPTESESACRSLPADLNLTSFEVKTERGKSYVIDVHSCSTVQSIIDEIKQLDDADNSPLKLLQDDSILPPDLPIWDVDNSHPLTAVTPKIGGTTHRPSKSRKRERKGAARRAARHRAAKNQSELTYEETTELMRARDRPLEDVEFKELEELMEESPSYIAETAACNAVSKHKESDKKRKVKLHGTLNPLVQPDECIRCMSLNPNGLPMWKNHNYKADRLKAVMHKYHLDVLGMEETCINWGKFKSSRTIASLLRNGHEPVRSVHSHNEHEEVNIGNVQRGGTATVVQGYLSKFVKDHGKDPTKLGRWSWYKVEGEPGHVTRFVTAYAPVGSVGNSGWSSNYKQQVRYIQENHLRTDPINMFWDDLIEALKQWRERGDRLVLMMDANNNVWNGKFTKKLAAEGLEMREAVHTAKPKMGPNTHINGSEPIDGIWYTKDLEMTKASYLPFDAQLGDHRPVAADFTQTSVLGAKLPSIAPHQARRLTSKVKRIRDNYIKDLEEKFKKNNILEKLQVIADMVESQLAEQARVALERLDRQMTSLMLNAEKNCRKLHAGHYEFSPAIKLWLDKCHSYRALIRLRLKMDKLDTNDPKKVRNGNPSNIYRAAWRCGIQDPSQIGTKELYYRYKHCKEHTKSLMADSPWMRKTFLSQKLADAIQNERSEEAKRIKEVLRNEAERKEWQGIHRATKADRAGAITFVDVKQADGSTVRVDTKEQCEQAIQAELKPRFDRAKSAPVCQGALFKLLGYEVDSKMAIDILEGKFDAPAGTDGATLLLFHEISNIWKSMKDGKVDIVITKEDFQYFWKRAKERTASSISKVHFGHYTSAAHSDLLSEVHARKLSLIAQTGNAPERWARGLSVMLEKVAGVALVTKLRAILLMEADFNFHNKLIFGKRMLDLARKNGIVPPEIYSEKGRTAEDAVLHQVLAYDIARQTRSPLIVASVDAAQCYDRIAHSIADLTLRASGVPESSIRCMLKPIREMEFFIKTAFGESDSYVGGKESPKQGSCQGNGGAPPTWQQISTTMLGAHRRAGHGVTVKSPISNKSCTMAGILYVDDTNLWTGMKPEEDLESVHGDAQEAINSWGNLLLSTGGALNPDKCKWTVHDMVTKSDGTWEYRVCKPELGTIQEGQVYPGTKHDLEREEDVTEDIDSLEMRVPQAGAPDARIDQLQSCQAMKNLGLYTPPDGSSEPQFQALRARVDEWTADVANSGLPTRSVWKSYQCQLWSGMKYGLGASPATLKQLEKGLDKRDHKLLSYLGVCKKITTPLRYLPACYGGVGLNSLVAEATTASLNSFLQHYGTETAIGTYLTASLENLQLELGVSGCPLNYDYDVWGKLATDSWVKSLWERVCRFKIKLDIEYKKLPPPRENDECIMERLVREGVRGSQLINLNRVRKHQEALFLSDIVTANGRRLDPIYLSSWHESYERHLGNRRSLFSFGQEWPTDNDWDDWNRAFNSSTLGTFELSIPLGKWINFSPRIWRAFWDEKACTLDVVSDTEGVLRYEYDEVRWFNRNSALTPETASGVPATITDASPERVRLHNSSRFKHAPKETPEFVTFQDHLKSYGGQWMWKDLRMGQSAAWVADCLRDGNLVCVTDGSYMKKKAPNVCSAGWILACKVTKRQIGGTLVEISPSADSYRGELLGMLAIRLFLLAVEEYYGAVTEGNDVCCDSKSALFTFEKKSQRVPAGSANTDIQRVLRTIKYRSKSTYVQHHVKAHQDEKKPFHKLTFEEQQNYHCDNMAKEAIQGYLTLVIEYEMEGETYVPPDTSRLPLELATVTIAGVKQTTDVGKGLKQVIGHRQAKDFNTKQNKEGKGQVPNEMFDRVDWKAVNLTLASKPKMYNLWYGKQCSGWCGVGSKLKYWEKGADSTCPNCGMLNEKAAHLTVCKDEGRTQLFETHVRKIREWLIEHKTQGNLCAAIVRYLKGRGSESWSRVVSRMGFPGLRQLCDEQDKIGWRNFTEGKLSKEFRRIQSEHLANHRTRLTIDSWLKGFVAKLLELTHSQWIYRCITKHHKTKGTKVLKLREDLFQEINRLLDAGAEGVAPEDRWMLEVDIQQLQEYSLQDMQFWIHAVEAARSASSEATKVSGGATSSWNDIIKDGKFSYLPKKVQQENVCHLVEKMERENAAELQSQFFPQRAAEKRDSTGEVRVVDSETESSAGTAGTAGRSNSSRKTEAGPVKAKMAPALGTSRKRRKAKSKNTANASVPISAVDFGSLNPQAETRVRHISQQATEADNSNLGLFTKKDTLTRNDQQNITAALDRSPIYRMGPIDVDGNQTMQEAPTLKVRREDIRQTSFRRLKDGEWLDDETINPFLLKYVHDAVPLTHCYSTHFFTRLRPPGGDYCYNNVTRWGRRVRARIDDGWDGLRVLYVPINIGNMHWVFIRVDMQRKRVELYDSQGYCKPGNKQYLLDMIQYLYDELTRDLPQSSKPTFESWRRHWRAVDKSREAPKQTNTWDCGVFMLLTVYLNSRGVPISRLMYDQYCVDAQRLRRSIAFLLIRDNELHTASSIRQHTMRLRPSSGAAKGLRHNKRPRTQQQIAVGSKKIRSDTSGNFEPPEAQRSHSRGRKRSAKSLADSDPSQLTIEQSLKLPKKRARRKETNRDL